MRVPTTGQAQRGMRLRARRRAVEAFAKEKGPRRPGGRGVRASLSGSAAGTFDACKQFTLESELLLDPAQLPLRSRSASRRSSCCARRSCSSNTSANLVSSELRPSLKLERAPRPDDGTETRSLPFATVRPVGGSFSRSQAKRKRRPSASSRPRGPRSAELDQSARRSRARRPACGWRRRRRLCASSSGARPRASRSHAAPPRGRSPAGRAERGEAARARRSGLRRQDVGRSRCLRPRARSPLAASRVATTKRCGRRRSLGIATEWDTPRCSQLKESRTRPTAWSRFGQITLANGRGQRRTRSPRRRPIGACGEAWRLTAKAFA